MKNPTDKRTKAYKEWKTLEEAREQELKDFKNLQPKKVKICLVVSFFRRIHNHLLKLRLLF